MGIESMKTTSFQKPALEDWEAKASASLKGKSLDSLYTDTYENIVLKPFYTAEDVKDNEGCGLPGEKGFRRGIEKLGYQTDPWKVANRLSYKSLDELEGKLKLALSKGQTAIAFEVKPSLFEDNKKLASFVERVGSDFPFSLNAGFLQGPMLAVVSSAERVSGKTLTGFIGSDPVAEASVAGGLPKEENAFYMSWSSMLEEADELMPELKTVLVNASPYHNSGANAVQELAIAVSTGVYLLQRLLENGWDLERALSKFVFNFSVGSNFFMETAKLRAARLLWSKAAEAFGAAEPDRKMVISAETSAYTKTVFDPYVNMLRVGNEAFAAVLGGIQYLHTGTFAEAAGKTDSFGERIARNTQLILKSEAQLERVADPAGGAWYIETITNQLAEKSWELFLEIDSRGGIYEALKSGWLQTIIRNMAELRKMDIHKRKKSIIGTNVYANLSDHPEEPDKHTEQTFFMDGQLSEIKMMATLQEGLAESFNKLEDGADFPPLMEERLAEPFEQLRFRAIRLERMTGLKPIVGLICLGSLKNHKARADFISGMMAAGGIHTERSKEICSSEEAGSFIETQGGKQFVICGSAEDYAQNGVQIAVEVKRKYPELQLFVAGLPDGKEIEEWKEAGVEGFIHIKSDVHEILTSMLDEMEVAADEKA